MLSARPTSSSETTEGALSPSPCSQLVQDSTGVVGLMVSVLCWLLARASLRSLACRPLHRAPHFMAAGFPLHRQRRTWQGIPTFEATVYITQSQKWCLITSVVLLTKSKSEDRSHTGLCKGMNIRRSWIIGPSQRLPTTDTYKDVPRKSKDSANTNVQPVGAGFISYCVTIKCNTIHSI